MEFNVVSGSSRHIGSGLRSSRNRTGVYTYSKVILGSNRCCMLLYISMDFLCGRSVIVKCHIGLQQCLCAIFSPIGISTQLWPARFTRSGLEQCSCISFTSVWTLAVVVSTVSLVLLLSLPSLFSRFYGLSRL